nr:unnamed protein product [Callosobruchus analis]
MTYCGANVEMELGLSGKYIGLRGLIKKVSPEAEWTYCIIHRNTLAAKGIPRNLMKHEVLQTLLDKNHQNSTYFTGSDYLLRAAYMADIIDKMNVPNKSLDKENANPPKWTEKAKSFIEKLSLFDGGLKIRPHTPVHFYKQPIEKTPSKDQAILLTAVEGVNIHDYIIAVGSIVGPKNVLFASRISNGRICIHLSNSIHVDKIITNHKTIKIHNHDIEIRRLVTPAQRLVISNVCPSISNNIIENMLMHLGIKLLSRMTCLRFGMPETEYSDILSFRRQVYMAPIESLISDSTTVSFEDTTYRTFLSVDGPSYTICKQPGHTLDKCSNRSHPSNERTVEEEDEADITPNILI